MSTGSTPARAAAAGDYHAVDELNRDRDPGDRVLVCLDEVHALGVEPQAAPDLGCDFLVAGYHKWLFGPRGTGPVWAATPPGSRSPGPSQASTGAPGAWIGGRTPSLPGAALFEPGGFHAFEHHWVLAEAFRFHLELGKPAVAARTRALATRLKDGWRRPPPRRRRGRPPLPVDPRQRHPLRHPSLAARPEHPHLRGRRRRRRPRHPRPRLSAGCAR
jgi:isopenicillin-N epimerase